MNLLCYPEPYIRYLSSLVKKVEEEISQNLSIALQSGTDQNGMGGVQKIADRCRKILLDNKKGTKIYWPAGSKTIEGMYKDPSFSRFGLVEIQTNETELAGRLLQKYGMNVLEESHQPGVYLLSLFSVRKVHQHSIKIQSEAVKRLRIHSLILFIKANPKNFLSFLSSVESLAATISNFTQE